MLICNAFSNAAFLFVRACVFRGKEEIPTTDAMKWKGKAVWESVILSSTVWRYHMIIVLILPL